MTSLAVRRKEIEPGQERKGEVPEWRVQRAKKKK